MQISYDYALLPCVTHSVPVCEYTVGTRYITHLLMYSKVCEYTVPLHNTPADV